MTGKFGVVYKGYLSGQYINDEVVAIRTLKGNLSIVTTQYHQTS